MIFVDWNNINLDDMNLHERNFEFLPLKILDTYYPNLSKYLSWTFIIQQNDLYTVKGKDYLPKEAKKLGLSFSGELTYYSYLNKDDSDSIYFPIEKYAVNFSLELSALSVVIIRNKSKFLSLFKFNYPAELYVNCRFLIELFRLGIEHNSNYDYKFPSDYYDTKKLRDKYYSDSGMSDSEITRDYVLKYLEYKDTRMKSVFLSNVVSSALTWLVLPQMSFFNAVANSYYEGSENHGFIEFYCNDDDVSQSVMFNEQASIDMVDLKFIRKLLEMTSKKLRLLVVSKSKLDPVSQVENTEDKYFDELANWVITGLGTSTDETYASIEFLGPSKWVLTTGSEVLSFDGQNYLIHHKNAPTSQFDKSDIALFFEAIGCDKRQYKDFLKVFNSIKKQKHGTMLIVSKGAKDEAERLCNSNRGIKIEPIDCKLLSQSDLLQMTRIDGAMLIDPNCTCYALGVILDGFVEPTFEGDKGRGARYNSAKLYIHNITNDLAMGTINYFTNKESNHAMAIVISEDGYIDVFTSENENLT